MRIFLTGGTGQVGSAVLDALVRAGHQVTALVRTPDGSRFVLERGGHPIIGDLGNPASYREAVEGQDGAIHAGADQSRRRVKLDRVAIETLTSALMSGRRPAAAVRPFFVFTSDAWTLGRASQPAAEDAPVHPIELVAWRLGHERLVLDAAANGLRTIVVRPGILYGGSRGTVAELLKDARNGLLRVLGDGDNRWALVYDRDLADLYVRLVASPDASGIYHANDEGDERVNDIVEAIAAHMPMRPDVRHVPLEEARQKLGLHADALVLDQVVRSPRARALGWTPALRSVAGNVPRLLEEWSEGQRIAERLA